MSSFVSIRLKIQLLDVRTSSIISSGFAVSKSSVWFDSAMVSIRIKCFVYDGGISTQNCGESSPIRDKI